jgi:anaerobic magnesium-protoporphyrin IX monomethyl ester cyclase
MITKKKSILLIYPPNQLMAVETTRPDGSLGPLYLASNLERTGYEVNILDASVGVPGVHSLQNTFYRTVKQGNGLIRIGLSFDEITDYVIGKGYGIVGISSNFTPQTKMAFNTARAIKRADPSIKVLAGGVNARNLYSDFLRTGLFDGVCVSEGEIIFRNMLDHINRGESLEGVVGAAYLKEGTPVVNQILPSNAHLCFPARLDDLEMPAWGKAPFEFYDNLNSAHGVNITGGQDRYAALLTSRGCPFSCWYCHISKETKDGLSGAIGDIRFHSIERVMQEIRKVKEYGVQRIFFEDDSLLANRERITSILRGMKDEKLSIADTNGVNLLHMYDRSDPTNWAINYPFLQTLGDAGFQQIVFPVESANNRIVRKYANGKVNHDRMNLPELMTSLRNVGIKCPVNIMIGFPDETREEMYQSFEMGKRLMAAGAPFVTYFVPIPFPGSRLYDFAVSGNYLDTSVPDPEAMFDVDRVSWTDRMNWKNPVMINTTVPPAEVEALRDKFNEETNTRDHLERRIKESAGHRLAQTK